MAALTIDKNKTEQNEFLRQVDLRIWARREEIGMPKHVFKGKTSLKPAFGFLMETTGENVTLRTLFNIAQTLGCHPIDLLPQSPASEADLQAELDSLRKRVQEQRLAIERMESATKALGDFMEWYGSLKQQR